MQSDYERQILEAVKEGLRKAVADKLGGYNSPLDKMLADIMVQHGDELRTLLVTGIQSAVSNEDFRNEIQDAIRKKLAKTFIERFGGEMEKQVNTLKSDPATRARITLAIEEIVKQKAMR
jgi:hypothetical protein